MKVGISSIELDRLLADARESFRKDDSLVSFRPSLLAALEELKCYRAIFALASTIGRTEP